jgi:hypothetical protein
MSGRETRDTASHLGLSQHQWGNFLDRWEKCLNAYEGTYFSPEDIRVVEVSVQFNGKNVRGRALDGPYYTKRREFMSQQKPYPLTTLPLHRCSPSCFLCQNIAQARDAERTGVQTNVLEERGDYLLLPCRYPAAPGHSLFLSRAHDEMQHRLHPLPSEKGRPACYDIAEGKTRGAILSIPDIEALIALCEEQRMIGITNHVLDAMSIPDHWHYQLYPADLHVFSQLPLILKERITGTFPSGWWQSPIDPFDTLYITLDSQDKLARVQEMLKNLETNNQVFTAGYGRGVFFISPRADAKHKRISVGSGVNLRYFTCGQKYAEEVQRHVSSQGTFSWNSFFAQCIT